MFKSYYFILLVFLTSLSVVSCNKKKSDSSSTSSYTSSLSYKLNGSSVTVSSVEATSMNIGVQAISITAQGSNPSGILTLFLDPNISVGAHGLGTVVNSIQYNQGSLSYAGVSGNITISKNDVSNKIVEGTFSASLTDMSSTSTISVTEGSFKVKY